MLGTAPVMATIPAENTRRAKAVYTDVVGLKVAAEPDADSLILAAGDGTQILVHVRGRFITEHTAFTFPVPDIDAAVDAFSEKGVTFEQYDMESLKTDERQPFHHHLKSQLASTVARCLHNWSAAAFQSEKSVWAPSCPP